MNSMRKVFSTIIAVAALLIAGPVVSQEYRISHFGLNEGITHQFVYTVNQDTRGYIWLGTGQGLCRFDGTMFNTDIVQDSLANEVAGVSYKDGRGVLWFGYQSGDIARYDGSTFTTVQTGIDLNSAVTAFAALDENNLIFSTLNNGVYLLNSSTGKAEVVSGLEQGMYTALQMQEKALLLGSQDGLAIYDLDKAGKSATLIMRLPELDLVKIQDMQPSHAANTFWIAAEDKGVYRLIWQGGKYTLSPVGQASHLERENVQSVFESSDSQLWVSTLRNGLCRLGKPGADGNFTTGTWYNKQNGLTENAIKRVFEDLEGNIWIATYGGGLTLFTGQAFSFLRQDIIGLEHDIQSVAITDEGVYFMGGPGGLFRYNKEIDKTATRITSVPADRVTALHLYKRKLFIGTERNGLFIMDAAGTNALKIPYEANSLGNQVSSIARDEQHLYVGTKDGIYVLDNDWKVAAHYTTEEGLPHNNIEHLFIDSKGRLLLATRTKGIYTLTTAGQINNLYPTGNDEIEFKSIAEDDEGGIWAATYGDGVICFKDDSVYQYNMAAGLKANFAYSIIKGSDHTLWVGHRLGISRINTDNSRISVYDKNIGMTGDCNPNAVFMDKAGRVHFGTTEGLVSYDASKENKRKLPPFTNIVRLMISDKEYSFDKEIVLPYRLYKLRIEFIGLNYSDPQAVRYQYKLDGYDLDWSEATAQTFALYPRIEDGVYTFYLQSFNSEGLSQETPVAIKIRIKPPFWKTWWFIILACLSLVSSVYLIIKIRERKQKQLQEYLERELALRTKEVVEQKEEIEIKNRDITDSINYAKRIQTSMLPPIRRLQQHFSGCFVFYSPRDIVSGDFYWFDQVNNNKFTIVCADSTGHGVPGAFMSMIGSTLIKDICTREAGNSPSQVLQVLDLELRNTLNQNQEDGTKPSDGMDIIVCEIDLKTHYVRYASAMRPMIIYRNGEEIFIKGSRNSVGGHYDREENLFEDEGLQLSKGDLIYMFSDGYSDQFGGPMGKKFKMVRLKNLLQDIHQKPMEEQYNHVKSTFNLWKENFDQVDDVLFMGIKI
jgi:ligand-binding sensor domain-containing protein/serine phosphatase RsbU (regulator of sigma subunit)